MKIFTFLMFGSLFAAIITEHHAVAVMNAAAIIMLTVGRRRNRPSN